MEPLLLVILDNHSFHDFEAPLERLGVDGILLSSVLGLLDHHQVLSVAVLLSILLLLLFLPSSL